MHTSDFKFYRPSPAEYKKTSKAKADPNNLFWKQSENEDNDFAAAHMEHQISQEKKIEVKHTKFLLMRLRNEEMNLRKSAFDREKKGFEEYLFEANSSEHRQNIKTEQNALKSAISKLTS